MTEPLPVYQDILRQGQALRQTLHYQSGAGQVALQTAAGLIRKAEQVVMVAIGASYNAAYAFTYRLAAVGIRVILEDASEFLHYTRHAYNGTAVFIVVSRSGESIEIVRAAEELKRQGQPVIAVTNEPNSTLAHLSDMFIAFGGPSDQLISIQTYVTTLLCLDFLAEAVIGQSPEDTLSGQQAALNSVDATLARYQSESQAWLHGAAPFQCVYLLGRGYAMATASQATLLFHEMARFPAACYPAGAFRHGPWEVMDGRIRAFIFAPEDNSLALNLALARDAARLGGQVTLITSLDREQAPDGVEVWSLPAVRLHLAPLLEILPLAFYIYEFAARQGHTPGVFRASTPITLTEGGVEPEA
jgi:glucosamine--fructose-6-phosphate aminotransferase (isomerizing)